MGLAILSELYNICSKFSQAFSQKTYRELNNGSATRPDRKTRFSLDGLKEV